MLILTISLLSFLPFRKILIYPISFAVQNTSCFELKLDLTVTFATGLLKIKFKNPQLILALLANHKMNFELILNKTNFEVVLLLNFKFEPIFILIPYDALVILASNPIIFK